MTYQASRDEMCTARPDRERVSDLLARYPGVSPAEAQEILTFLRTGRHLDIGLLTSNDGLRPNLDAFMQDHKTHFRVKWFESAAVIGGMAALLLVVWMIWEAFA